MRGERTEAEMIAAMSYRAEKHLLDDRGPFFVLRIYLENGEYRKEIDAVMRKHGQSPLLRRAEAAVARRLGLERCAIRMRYRLRGETPPFLRRCPARLSSGKLPRSGKLARPRCVVAR